MINCKGTCRQGRDTCSTPGGCGFYGQLHTANSDGSDRDLPVTMDADPVDWLMVTCKTVILLCAVGFVGIVAGFVWQRLGG